MFAGEPRAHRQVEARARTASYFSARERLLNRHHDLGEARKLARQVRSTRPTASWSHHQQQQKQSQVEEKTIKIAQTEAAASQRQQQQMHEQQTIKTNEMDQKQQQQQKVEAGAIERQEAHEEAHNSDEQLASNMPDQLDQQNKQHVGPVMGIFFKVWSLVKVTKMRQHNNKMRRQNSEDASQFHFISGDQFAAASTSGQAAGSSGLEFSSGVAHKHILRDNHFRRAGSQPPLSTTTTSGAFSRQLDFNPASRLQVHQLTGSSATTGGGGRSQTTVSTTNSSSSGVSSATSGSLVASNPNAVASSPLSELHNDYDTHKAFMQGGQSSNSPEGQSMKSSGTGRSWTARIKSRASGSSSAPIEHVQQQPPPSSGSSYVSRYRFRRADANLRQMDQGAYKPQLAACKQATTKTPLAATRQLRSQSDSSQQLNEVKRGGPQPTSSLLLNRLQQQRQQLRGRAQRMRSDDCEEDEDEDLQDDEEEEDDRFANNSDEDSDLNDIYSTPNDSIQSVPSSQQLLLAHEQRRRSSSTLNGLPMRSMVKSFSTQNFNAAPTGLHQPEPGGKQNRKLQQLLIDERDERQKKVEKSSGNSSSSSSSSSSQASSTKTTTNKSDNSNNNKLLLNDSKKLSTAASGGLLSNSRFFISSSSSEDSQAAAAATVNASPPSLPASCQQRAQIPVHFGLHRHEPAPAPPLPEVRRPDSLAFNSRLNGVVCERGSSQLRLALDSTPPGVVAAMSPAVGHQQQQQPLLLMQPAALPSGYKKSPSLFEMSLRDVAHREGLRTRFSSKYPNQPQIPRPGPDVFKFMNNPTLNQPPSSQLKAIPNSISLHDCKLSSASSQQRPYVHPSATLHSGGVVDDMAISREAAEKAQYKLAQMLLKLGSTTTNSTKSSNSNVRDQEGCTALMLAIISENLAAFKCLLDHGVDLNEINNEGATALDLIANQQAGPIQLEMFNLLLDHKVDFDQARQSDGTRLLDRLISDHQQREVEIANNLLKNSATDKLAYIDCLLHNGAKLGSSTWLAASGKHGIQLRLLRKLCQDGYFLYKKNAIEAAVYRFEYALKRIDELEQQLSSAKIDCWRQGVMQQQQQQQRRQLNHSFDHTTTTIQQQEQQQIIVSHPNQLDQRRELARSIQLVKYQTYLGLSRCERKRRFFRRALEFAHMSILIDSTSYEGYYSKAHILKDLGELDDALIAIDQTSRLVQRSSEHINRQLSELQIQEESIVFDGCFQVHDPQRASWIKTKRLELVDNLEYLEEARGHVTRLRCEILEDKLLGNGNGMPNAGPEKLKDTLAMNGDRVQLRT